jgi:hypothetical protein
MGRRGLEMKHGDKAKVKAAKAKTSGKEAHSKTAAKAKGAKASGKKESSASSKAGAARKKDSSVKASPKASVKAEAVLKSNGKPGRADAEVFAFSNPAIENAFKRAVKKYSNAFRRLTD